LCSHIPEVLEDFAGQLTEGSDPSPNLSLALSYKEREAEYIFLFGGALMLPRLLLTEQYC